MFGRSVHVAFRGVHDNNATAGGSLDIDIVHADTGSANNLQRCGRVDEFCCYFGDAAHDQAGIRRQHIA